MKPTLLAAIIPAAAAAAVPLRWTVETSRATPVTFEAYQGETIELEAALNSYGKPLELSGIAALYWQTNGMGNAYWQTTAAVNSNRLSAVWTPEMDVGARAYNCFIGSPSNIYHAAFQLRLRPSPGAVPNTLPLPQPIIDFAKIRVLNPPWGSGGIDTNAVRDIINETVDGAARPLPPYLHALDFCDGYPEDAAAYYRSKGDGKTDGGCSAVRDGGFLCRNFDYPFDERAEFIVKMSAGPGRFASVGVAQVGTNLTEQMVTSGKWSKWYKALPGATVDGINERGVCAEINVVDTPVRGWHATGDLHPLAAVRWVLDNATNAQSAAEYIAANIRFPQGWTQNFHYMVADETATYIVENGTATPGDEYHEPDEPVTMTNFLLSNPSWTGMGYERFLLLLTGGNITNAWYTNAYRRETNPKWVSEFGGDWFALDTAIAYWSTKPKEAHRGETFHVSTVPPSTLTWWQTVHTSVYDISNRVLRVAVQERDDWYVFQVSGAGGGVDTNAVRALVDASFDGGTNAVNAIPPRVAAIEDEVASIPRITESNDHEGWAKNADLAYESRWAEEADKADEVGGYTGGDFDDMYDAIVVANNTIESHTLQLAQQSQSIAEKAPASLTNTVNAWQTYWDGDDVRVTITNYYGSTDLPRLYIEQRTNEVAMATNLYRVVWDETTRLKPIISAVASNAADIAALDAVKADRAWGSYDSHTGATAPADVASVSAHGVVLGAGMAYQGYATNAGEVWMLTANEPQTVTVSDSGLFCIYDADGNAMIEIVKGDKRTVSATVAAVQKTSGTFEVTFNVVSATHPIIEVCDDLIAADWCAEGDAGFPCAVTWRGASGAWVCDLAVGDMPKLFVRGSYEVGGESYVKIMGERPAPASLMPRVDALEDALGEISAALDAILEGH